MGNGPVTMGNRANRVMAAFHRKEQMPLPRGELWLGAKILKGAGLEDTLSGRLRLVERLDHDMICFSIARTPRSDPLTGYRYFTIPDLEELSNNTDRFVTAVIDGPFQRLSERMGLMGVLTQWIDDRKALLAAYDDERRKALHLLQACLAKPLVQGVAIADDLAGDQSPVINPRDMETYFFPFYHQAIHEIHGANALALFHSCGNIGKVISQLVSCRFDGLAAIQDHTNDLLDLKKRYGSSLILMGGIEGELLEREVLSSRDFSSLTDRLRLLNRDGGFILASATGLYAERFLERVEAIYRAVTEQ